MRSTRHPELRVLSWAAVEAYEPRGVELCISIQDPEAAPARLAAGFAAVLRLSFHDVDAARAASGDVLFAPEHAAAILAFIARWPEAERIVVHCHAGVSRSPAVALGLCDVLGLSWTDALEGAHPYWNRWVRAVLAREAAGRSRAAAGSASAAAPDERAADDA